MILIFLFLVFFLIYYYLSTIIFWFSPSIYISLSQLSIDRTIWFPKTKRKFLQHNLSTGFHQSVLLPPSSSSKVILLISPTIQFFFSDDLSKLIFVWLLQQNFVWIFWALPSVVCNYVVKTVNKQLHVASKRQQPYPWHAKFS